MFASGGRDITHAAIFVKLGVGIRGFARLIISVIDQLHAADVTEFFHILKFFLLFLAHFYITLIVLISRRVQDDLRFKQTSFTSFIIVTLLSQIVVINVLVFTK